MTELTIKAWRPWDSPFAPPEPRGYKSDKEGYSERRECRHPMCDAIIRNDSITCKQHTQWYQAAAEKYRPLLDAIVAGTKHDDLRGLVLIERVQDSRGRQHWQIPAGVARAIEEVQCNT